MFASLLVVALIGAIAWAGSAIGLSYLFGVVLPYVAVVTFFLGVIWRMVYWAKSPVPFSIPTTGGQEKSLDFIKHEKWDCPNTKFGVVVRMFLEVCFFRSLFRNTAADVREFDPVTKGPAPSTTPPSGCGSSPCCSITASCWSSSATSVSSWIRCPAG